MQGYEVTLPEMLACREHRALLQQELIARYHCPVISFCMNIPGPCIFRKNCASVPEERSAIPLQTEQSSAG